MAVVFLFAILLTATVAFAGVTIVVVANVVMPDSLLLANALFTTATLHFRVPLLLLAWRDSTMARVLRAPSASLPNVPQFSFFVPEDGEREVAPVLDRQRPSRL